MILMLMAVAVQSAFSQSLKKELDSLQVTNSQLWDLVKLYETQMFSARDFGYSMQDSIRLNQEKLYNLKRSKGDSLQIANLESKITYFNEQKDNAKLLDDESKKSYEMYRALASANVYKISDVTNSISKQEYENMTSNLINKYGESTAKRLINGEVWVGMTTQMMKDAGYIVSIYYTSGDNSLGRAGVLFKTPKFFKVQSGTVKSVSSVFIKSN